MKNSNINFSVLEFLDQNLENYNFDEEYEITE